MSKQGRDRDPRDFPEPSTSSGHRSKTPYSRSLEHERKHSSGKKDKLKSVFKSEYDSDASTSTYQSSQYDSQETEIKSEPMDVKSEVGSGDTAAKSEDTVSTQQCRNRRETIFVSRPKSLENKKGVSGRQIMLQSNHFRLITLPDWDIYLYRVDFEPDETRTAVRKGLLRLHQSKFRSFIFDGTVLYTATKLPDNMELTSTRKSDNAGIKITIRSVGSISREDPRYIVFFNITMRKCLEHLKLQLVGHNYYDAQAKIPIYQYKLELWPGYVTSIRRHENEIMMGVEVSHKVLRQETLLHILRNSSRNKDNYQDTYSREVCGITVITDYNDHIYRIEDVDFNASPSSTFSMKSGKEISYAEYYWTKYQIRIKDCNQPMLVTKTKPKMKHLGKADVDCYVYLVPELCRPVGLSGDMKNNFNIMKQVAQHTRLSPGARIERLLMFNERLRKEENVVQEFHSWNMKLDRALVDVPARVLPPERLTFGRNFTINSGQGDWTRDMQKAPLLVPKELRHWVIIVSERGHHSLQRFLDNLYRVSHGLAFRVQQPQICTIPDDSAAIYVDCLERILSKNMPDLVLCIASNARSDRYSAIKKKCCIERPIPSQVILQKNLDGRNAMTIATKLAIQMNCKLGGAPWKIDMPVRGIMAIGFDICRDSNTRGKEYLAMIATTDNSLTDYFSYLSSYHNHEELGEQLCEGVRRAVYAYRLKNKALPMFLLIYRDGVSEGQVSEVNEYEVESLKKKLEELYYGPNFKMTFVIVCKNNTRLFHDKRNPPIGTIVDDVVTSPFKYDFFLVSQQVRQGTISPTAYNVISDNSGLQPDVIQLMTFKLTHMYYNCSSTVRSPAPCHYAKKLSTLVGQCLHRPPSTQLQSQLFFL